MKELESLLTSKVFSKVETLNQKDFYRFFKPILISSGIFPKGLEDFAINGGYLRFVKNLQSIATLPHGLDLALAMMVEVNVASGILQYGTTKLAAELQKSMFGGQMILATGVSEPEWEGRLAKLKSSLTLGKLSGTKSFITNGQCADGILWVLPEKESFSVYLVRRDKYRDLLIDEPISTDYLKLVSHLKLTANEYPLEKEDLVLEDYKTLGIELRLKELFGLTSLLLGFVNGLGLINKDESIKIEFEKLVLWRDKIGEQIHLNNFQEMLSENFPFPNDKLLQSVSQFYHCDSPKELININPDFTIFIWEDKLTKYLKKTIQKN
ncbi:MAG: acyl-CoA dehydrogenase family protein [Leptospira sp.]|nr:acyl-CoA dehydrogenase family protein [Leptospira sp.]